MLKKSCVMLLVLLMSVSFLMTACAKEAKHSKKNKAVAVKPLSPEEVLNAKVENILQGMTLEEKIGQIMFIGVSGPTLNAVDLDLLQNMHVGGVILFDRNMQNPEQVRALNLAVQEKGSLPLKMYNNAKLPLFISVDEEGGQVQRMRENWPDGRIPSQEKIGAAGNAALAKEWASKTAKSMKYMGFNVNFAPVADLGSSRERSYSKDHIAVTNFVDAAMEGYAEEKVMSTLKHFPGIGRAVVDPHYDGSVIKEDIATLEKTDLVPFAEMIKKKNNDTFMVMISHLTYTAFDSELPSSISKNIITGLLKEKLGFKGIIITDDLEMGAVAKHYSHEEMGVRALNAGVDAALICHNPTYIKIMYQSLLDACKQGKITQERIDESVRKILRAKLVNLKVEI